MTVDYNDFAKTFSNSRKNMKWEEIEYFISFLSGKKDLKILDVGCGNARLLGELKKHQLDISDYLGVDLSSGLLEEAKNNHPENNFQELNMLDINTLHNNYNVIFLIASFHHLDNLDNRLSVLRQIHNLLEDGGIVFMTNWSLNSNLNQDKYKSSMIEGSENDYGSTDYSIKIGTNHRYYHCFTLEELTYLFKQNNFEIIENREFDTKKNFISIIKN
ncbi:MAG: class I SAM-dependent methyltransferase [Candidatus Gracilibacteria bacterium]|nr:class I SAM-dependent methyltransferase [Candidatus Gracilibacteria bacterium]